MSEVLLWRTLKSFCEEHYPDKKFKGDAARKQFLEQRGVMLQKDEHGELGVATPKDGKADQKEIRVGKRIAASKLKIHDYGDGSGCREDLERQMMKNKANLGVKSNSQDCSGVGLKLAAVTLAC